MSSQRICPCQSLNGSAKGASAAAPAQAGSPENPLCPSCVTAKLEPHLRKRSETRRKHAEMRTWCADRLQALRCEEGDSGPAAAPGVGRSDASRNADAGTKKSENKQRDILTDANSASEEHPGIRGASLSRLKDQSDALRCRLDELRLVCGEQSVQVAALALRNDERHQRLQEERRRVEAARLGLDGIWVGVLGGGDDGHDEEAVDGGGGAIRENELEKARGHAEAAVVDGLPGAISSLVSEVRSRRLALALRAFDAHRIDIGPDCSNDVQNDDSDAAEGQDPDETGARERAAARKERMRRRPRGVGKICALPLPHAGPALYGVLPPAVLASSLRLVASLTAVLSRCLSISLPHPIYLRPLVAGGGGGSTSSSSSSRANTRAAAALARAQRKECGDIIETVDDRDTLEDVLPLNGGVDDIENGGSANGNGNGNDNGNGNGNGNASSSGSGSQALISSASSIRTLGRTARWAFAKATGHSSSEGGLPQPSTATSTSSTTMADAPPSYSNLSNAKQTYNAPIDKATMATRIRHAAAAVVWEGPDGTEGEYTLIPPGWTGAPIRARSPEDNFATGLTFLQNNIVALCIRAGVQVSEMWPAEALLLNLDLLRIHLSSQTDEK
mmetsp:Transcript_18774/g.54021  ORF Transcript_18774/g.54021 Transcript_18774/m.54021 type:complete len:618 (-) Transcript_18774:1491-3344(-)